MNLQVVKYEITIVVIEETSLEIIERSGVCLLEKMETGKNTFLGCYFSINSILSY